MPPWDDLGQCGLGVGHGAHDPVTGHISWRCATELADSAQQLFKHSLGRPADE